MGTVASNGDGVGCGVPEPFGSSCIPQPATAAASTMPIAPATRCNRLIGSPGH